MVSIGDSPVADPLKDPIMVHYNPPDGEFNIWMYGIIFIGCAFVLFVISSVYVICKTPAQNEPPTPVRRAAMTATMRERQSLSGRGKEAL